MKTIKALLISMLTLVSMCAFAQSSVMEIVDDMTSMTSSTVSNYPQLLCNGVLNSSYPYTQPLCVGSGVYGILYQFTGVASGYLCTLYVDTRNEGHWALVDYAGTQLGVSFSENNIIQLSIDTNDDNLNCVWYLYKFSD